jgi:hypothetical protein
MHVLDAQKCEVRLLARKTHSNSGKSSLRLTVQPARASQL